MKFEWDEEKNRINKEKHKISFSTAKFVFSDRYAINFPDENHSWNENRRIVIGKVRDVLFVSYTVRHGDTIRMISARRATKREEELYYVSNGIFRHE